MSIPWSSDLISDFMELTDGNTSPDLFRKWSAITMIGGALERRVWVKTQNFVFANMYVLLCAAPGIGKGVIEDIRALWRETFQPGTKQAAFHVASDSVTKASLMDELARARQVQLTPQGETVVYHSLQISAEEFSVLLPAYDMEFIGVLNSIYMNKPLHSETRRSANPRELKIDNPQFTILAGIQPALMASMFPEEVWSTGLARRLIMIHSNEIIKKPLFGGTSMEEEARAGICSKLSHLSTLFGQMKWTGEGVKLLEEWHMQDGPPTPTHSKLASYNRNRSLNATKLAMISAVARTGGLIIELCDIERAIAWLLEAERRMPDVFREMVGKSDSQVLEELHYMLTQAFGRNRKPVPGDLIWKFLSMRVPSDKVERLIMVAERAGIMRRYQPGLDEWVPQSKLMHAEE